ncbi:MAG TPA: hypothetical protein EYG86_02750 [Crocinitomicaceae bacterium]|nr:hypothetical protein [Crocinitomicaceae bacterium]
MINLSTILLESANKTFLELVFFITINIVVILFFRSGTAKKKIKFSWLNSKNEDNLIEAYIVLAAEMMKGDKGHSKDKLKYLLEYFHQHFPEGYYNFRESINEAYTTSIDVASISKWMSNYHFKKKDHLQIVYFLCGLCIIDGKFSQKEISSLRTIVEELKVTDKELDGIIAMYQSNFDESKRSEWRKSEDVKIRPSQKKICCDIIGVPTNSTMDAIKKAYRKLVKLHHPDRFHNESREQQTIAQAKFITIQKAYEVLEKLAKKI